MFESLAELRNYAQAWAWMHNNERPHAALGHLTPTEFLLKYGKFSALNQRQFRTLQQDNNSNSNSLVLNVAKCIFLKIYDLGHRYTLTTV